MIKGILKRHSLSGDSVASSLNDCTLDSDALDESPKLKRVSFDGAEPARVFEADEWDRSPAEVTLRLTYKDVVELRELNVSLVRAGPLMMERTPSRRPTRQRTSTPPSPQPTESSNHTSSLSDTASSDPEGQSDEVPSPSSPPFMASSSPRLSPTYQYQPFTSQSLPPLLEDAPSSVENLSERRGRGHSASASDSYFTFRPVSASSAPPGLIISTPRLKGVPSPALAPPSPLALSSGLPSRSPSPKPTSRPGSPIPVYRHHTVSSSSPPRIKTQSTPGSPRSLGFPTLSRRASVPEELTLEAGKKPVPHLPFGNSDSSPTWKPLTLTGVHDNSSSPSLGLSKSPLGSPALTPGSSALPRRSAMSLMGWELRRTGSGSGKRGFGLVRKGSTGA